MFLSQPKRASWQQELRIAVLTETENYMCCKLHQAKMTENMANSCASNLDHYHPPQMELQCWNPMKVRKKFEKQGICSLNSRTTPLASIMTAPPIFVALLGVAHVWVLHLRSYLNFVCKTFASLSFHTPNNILHVLSLSSY